MYEVHGEGNVSMYNDLSEVQREGKFTVYSELCLRYRLRRKLLCRLMCV